MFDIDWSNMFSDRSNVQDARIEDAVHSSDSRESQQRRDRRGKFLTAIKLKLTIDLKKVGLLTHVASNGMGPRRRGTWHVRIIESSQQGTV